MVTPKPYLPEKRAKYTNSQKFAIISLYSLGYLLGGLVHRNSSREVTMIMNLVNFWKTNTIAYAFFKGHWNAGW